MLYSVIWKSSEEREREDASCLEKKHNRQAFFYLSCAFEAEAAWKMVRKTSDHNMLVVIRDGHFWQFLISIIDRFQKLLIECSGGGACVGAGHGRNGDNKNI